MVQRADRLAQFVTDRVPDQDALVEVLCEDHVGTYTPPFLCRWTKNGWLNGTTSTALEAEVLGWRLVPPARAPWRAG